MKNPSLDAACAVAYLALSQGIPEDGLTEPSAEVVTIRKGGRLAILYRPHLWFRQSVGCFGPKALTVAVMENSSGPQLARIFLEIELAKKPGGKHRLVSYSIPTRAVHQFSENRLPRAHLDTKPAIPMKSWGMKHSRPGRAAKFAKMESVA